MLYFLSIFSAKINLFRKNQKTLIKNKTLNDAPDSARVFKKNQNMNSILGHLNVADNAINRGLHISKRPSASR